jgi:hypothetical protein
VDKLWGIPYQIWYTVFGATLALVGGFIGKMFGEYRDQLAADRKVLAQAHRLLGELGIFAIDTGMTVQQKEQRLGKTRIEYETELRRLTADVRTRKYIPLAAELTLLGYHDDRNVQYMLKKLRAAFNRKLYAEMERQHAEAVKDGRAGDLVSYMDHVSKR